MHWGVVAAFVVVIAAYVMLQRHILGYHIKLAGQAPKAARKFQSRMYSLLAMGS